MNYDTLYNTAYIIGGIVAGVLLGYQARKAAKSPSQTPKSDPTPKLEASKDLKTSLPPTSGNGKKIDCKALGAARCDEHAMVVKGQQDIIELINKNHAETQTALKGINSTLMKSAREAGATEARIESLERDVERLKDQ